MEPTAVLVVPLKIQVGLRTLRVERLAVVGIFMATTQHMLESGATVEPNFQNIGALGVVESYSVKSFSSFGKCCANIFHSGAAPRFDATVLHHVGRDIQNLQSAGMQLATVFV